MNYFAPFGRNTNTQYTQAIAPVAQTAMQQPALFAKNFSDNYGHYQTGLSNNTTAQANFYGSLAAQAGLAQAANSAMIGNLGSAALTGYGQASQGAFDAWKGNQQSYNAALASMHDSNQKGVTGAGALNAISNFSGNFGGGGGGGSEGGFSASGPNGPIASGSSGGGALSGLGDGFSFSGGREGGGGAQAMDNVMSLAQSGAKRLDDQHYSSRLMPSQMLDQSLKGFTDLGQQAYAQGQQGMNQFYGFLDRTAERPDFKGALAMLSDGYRNSDSQVNNLFNNSLGQTPFFKSPLQNQQDQWAVDDAAAERKLAADAERTRRMNAFMNSWADEVRSGARRPGMYGRR